MHFALNVLGLVAVVGFVAAASRRYGVSEPLALVVVGIGLSFVPDVLDIEITPDLVLFGLLPPLLYAAAIRTSLVDFRANRRSILLLSVGLVDLHDGRRRAGGLVADPRASAGAAAFALGAVVAPPDAVAATAVARRVGMPRRIVSILEGESLVNDATALVALSTAIAAITLAVTRGTVGWDFVRGGGRRRRSSGSSRRVRARHDPHAASRTRARHHAVVRGAVRRLPAGRGDPRLGRARRRGDRAAARAQGAACCSRRRRGSPRTSTGAPCSSCSRTRSSC